MAINKYALILGASSGFGKATALKLAEDGFNILGVHLDRAQGVKEVEETRVQLEAMGVHAMFFNCNAADEVNRVDVIEKIKAHFLERDNCTIQVLLHSLAFGTLRSIISADPNEQCLNPKSLQMTMDVMANALVYWTQGIFNAGLITRGGRILTMTSAGARRCLPTYGAVSAAKAASEAYIRQLAYELAPWGITANSIRAGVTPTPAMMKIPGSDIITHNALMRNPNHRMTQPQDVANAISLIVRPESQWINGAIIGVDGGEDSVDLTWWKPEDNQKS